TPASNASGAATLMLTTDDLGHTGSGGAITDFDAVTINVIGQDSPPVDVVPTLQTTPEDTSLTFSTANGNAISISDPDAGSSQMLVTLAASSGTLTLFSTSGLNFTGGDGIADNAMTFTGTLADINAALDGLVFTPAADANGSVTLGILTNDQSTLPG